MIIQENNCTMIIDGKIVVAGKELPPCTGIHRNTTIINNKVFVDGYEFKDGKWKKTLRALWHKWF